MSRYDDDLEHKATLAKGLEKALGEVEKAQALTREHVAVMNSFYPRYNAHRAKWKTLKSSELEQWSADDLQFEAALKTLQRRETDLSIQLADKQKEAEQWRRSIAEHNKETALRKYPEGPIRDQVRKHIEMR